MEASDAEDELGDWLDEHGVGDGWDLAPMLVAGGLDAAWLASDGRMPSGDGDLDGAVRWLAYTVETEMLMNEIEDAATRISTLVGAAKQYSQMDRAPYQVVDVHELLDSHAGHAARKIGDGITVVKDYDRTLPPIPAYAAELNQVWTNLIDNAVQAMGGGGHADDPDLPRGRPRGGRDRRHRPRHAGRDPARIFEPFFTTKPVGEGTGLGLDISWRIVVNKHHGDLRVESRPATPGSGSACRSPPPTTPPPSAAPKASTISRRGRLTGAAAAAVPSVHFPGSHRPGGDSACAAVEWLDGADRARAGPRQWVRTRARATLRDRSSGVLFGQTGARDIGGMAFILWLIAVILFAGIVQIVRGALLFGIVLIVVGLLVGPGGVSIFT